MVACQTLVEDSCLKLAAPLPARRIRAGRTNINVSGELGKIKETIQDVLMIGAISISDVWFAYSAQTGNRPYVSPYGNSMYVGGTRRRTR